MKFEEIIDKVRKGEICVARTSWNGKQFMCSQISSTITKDIIPNMQSLPDCAKEFIKVLRLSSIHYHDQFIIISIKGSITYYIPSGEDINADDWYIIDGKSWEK